MQHEDNTGNRKDQEKAPVHHDRDRQVGDRLRLRSPPHPTPASDLQSHDPTASCDEQEGLPGGFAKLS